MNKNGDNDADISKRTAEERRQIRDQYYLSTYDESVYRQITIKKSP